MINNLFNSYLAVKFDIAPTKFKRPQEWVRIRDSPIPYIKKLAEINNDDYCSVLRVMLSGCIYVVGCNQYKLFTN